MNERIKELYEQSVEQHVSNNMAWEELNPEKFAELLIQENAAELNRLKDINQELLEASRIALPYVQQTLHGHIKEYEYDFSNKAAIEKEREMKLHVITILNAIDLATGETE